ncbi:hypothetical protein DL1_19600 [Thioclava dalianensis]|uniref:Uncharacterized protein n=1 Tax=Thioclava dalianensis TaxID=1185766 RepID=A0A074TCF2_9RHOB|nr:hypothetical protein [Thioclava dalianensis]KEP67810.1 hypothetical protein DL1_19600 [Thioclava dalianensis]SFN48689.1 hypothetical protein SAMN05216224_10633 [Thioclava dalianensis]
MSSFLKRMLAADKFRHLTGGFMMALTGAAFFLLLPLDADRRVAAMMGLIAAAAIAVAKEIIWDKAMHEGDPEALDALATILGAAAGALVFYAT